MDPADGAKVHRTVSSFEHFEGILGTLEFAGVNTPAAPGWYRRNRVSLFHSAARHRSTSSVFAESLVGRVELRPGKQCGGAIALILHREFAVEISFGLLVTRSLKRVRIDMVVSRGLSHYLGT